MFARLWLGKIAAQNKEIAAERRPPMPNCKSCNEINDSGARMEFNTGAVREPQDKKGRYDLISPIGMMRLARWYELGAQKYEARNWEKGLPFSNCLNSMFRHLVKYMAGYSDEDHLAAIAWNAFALMHYEELKPELNDIPTRKDGEPDA
jgi:hypothetical protein